MDGEGKGEGEREERQVCGFGYEVLCVSPPSLIVYTERGRTDVCRSAIGRRHEKEEEEKKTSASKKRVL